MPRVSEEVLIPKSRVGALIGKGGTDRNRIAKSCQVSLKISSDGIVTITGASRKVWVASQIVEAIGRGFTPDDAMTIKENSFRFDVLHINEYSTKNKKRTAELRGRIIGTQGKIKKVIEKKTKTRISIQGKTVAIIGPDEGADIARRVLEMLLRGSQYGSAIGFMKRKIEASE